MTLTRVDKDNQSFDVSDSVVSRRVTSIKSGNLLEGVTFDYVSAAYPTATSEVYTYKNGGSGGDTVATITLVYTDSTKEFISSVERS